MSTSAREGTQRSRPGANQNAALVAIGLLALLVRAQVLPLPGNDRVSVLACMYAAILAASLLAPAGAKSPARMRSALVLGIGLAAVCLAAVAAGRPTGTSFASWALPLSLLAAVAEEALFRRAAYGWLERYGAAVAVFGSALMFAAIHIPLYGLVSLPVDLGAGLMFSWQRWASGRWEVSAATHAAANFLAVILR